MSKTTKITISLVVVALIVWVVWLLCNKHTATIPDTQIFKEGVPPESDVVPLELPPADGGDVLLQGKVLSDEFRAGIGDDGGISIPLHVNDGEPEVVKIVYPPKNVKCSNFIPRYVYSALLENKENEVEVSGRYLSDMTNKFVSVCESPEYYIRIMNNIWYQ